ncbi:hypothetical protein KL86PLE_90328 [uncultured Pleomorphomonas sp.]|uniref:Uncharacterized protein n=1 Tax=uncultured Pleomorphomonas sp. TaxID=442121 RepID=A0A212LP34_9HYPH|nr:hypothetical protein KL86PLE_90328 [uncultured Pleomorphomonas sp.]
MDSQHHAANFNKSEMMKFHSIYKRLRKS